MADSRTVAVVPLKGSNFLTWKVLCQIVLMREGLWNIVNGLNITLTRLRLTYAQSLQPEGIVRWLLLCSLLRLRCLLLARGLRRSHRCLGEFSRPIPEENVGEQTEPPTQTSFFSTEIWRLRSAIISASMK